ncbi:MAG: esterase-like activity of phytase family protein [Rhodovulum sp.]
MATLGIAKTEASRGLSGIEVSADGTQVLAVSDDGWFLRGHILRTEGAPSAFSVDPPPIRMRNLSGDWMAGHQRDAEGLAIAPDGRVFVSFEIYHRVRLWRDLQSPAIWMPDRPDIAGFGPNSGMEALALGPDGALYALPETLVMDGGIPVLRFQVPPERLRKDGTPLDRYTDIPWTVDFTLPARGRFRPVGADFGPDGRFYLLERAVVAPIGFRSRVRRFVFGPDGATKEETLLETPLGRHGNLEGISVWRDGAGAIRLTMITDDNGLALQRNQMVEYRVVRTPGDS